MVASRYRLERQIGEGGMASVWLAYDTTLLRPVAIKFVWQRDLRRTQELIDAFLREARLAASVVHRNVVQVLDFGVLPSSTPYMVMEALRGETLGDMFNAGAQFTLEEVVQIGARALQGLIAVHQAGIVHRDLKPENVFLVKEHDGFFPKLLDFGISRSLDRHGERRSAVTTREGRVVGTPEYMSPEQAGGCVALDRRTDIYSMGVILYETIVGDVPYKSNHLGELIMRITCGNAPPIIELVPAAGKAISDVIQKAMRSDPAQRFADAQEMSDAWKAAAELTLAERGSQGTLAERDVAERRKRTRATTPERQPEPGAPALAGALSSADKPARAQLRDWEEPTVMITGPLVKPQAPPSRLLWGAAAALLVAAGVLLLMIIQFKPAANPGNKFIVVQSANGSQAQATEAVTGAQSAPSTEIEVSGKQPTAKVRAPRKAPRAGARHRPPVDEAALAERAVARDFSRQKASVARCFESFSDTDLPQLSVRITIDEQGRVVQSAIAPAEYKDSIMGACVRDAVNAMRFAPRSGKAAYRVPLIARRAP